MLRIYYSNRLERLALAQASLLERPLSDPLLPERIVTQSPATANGLAQRLAERLGVVANVDFALPASFVWEVYAQQLPQGPPRALLDRQSLVWAVFDRLHALPVDPAFAEPANYLRGDNRELRTYQLACRIADLLDQYPVYRPDWILAWERGEESHWQARLWRLLTEGAAPRHRARLWDELRTLSEASGLDPARLPERVSVFGISALAPVHLDVLERIARLTEVHLFTVNPSLAWWGDITSARDLARLRARWRAQRRPDASEYYEAGHPLLASMGHQGRELFDQLQGLQAEELELFEEPEADTLLAGLQRDLLILTDRSGADQDPSEVRPGDLSVQVHACHSPLREVQVLHDRLLDLFERLPGLEAPGLGGNGPRHRRLRALRGGRLRRRPGGPPHPPVHRRSLTPGLRPARPGADRPARVSREPAQGIRGTRAPGGARRDEAFRSRCRGRGASAGLGARQRGALGSGRHGPGCPRPAGGRLA